MNNGHFQAAATSLRTLATRTDDPKVRLNLAVAEHYGAAAGGSAADRFRSALVVSCVGRESEDLEQEDDPEKFLLRLDLAVADAAEKKWRSAADLLEPVVVGVAELDQEARIAVLVLMLEMFLGQGMVEKAEAMLKELENWEKSVEMQRGLGKSQDDGRYCVLVPFAVAWCKAKVHLEKRQFAEANAEITNAIRVLEQEQERAGKERRCISPKSAARDKACVMFLKAHLEYRVFEFQKAMETLLVAHQSSPVDLDSRICFLNNAACLYMRIQKPGLAAILFSKALNMHSLRSKGESNQGFKCMSEDLTPEILYNYGIQKLYTKNYESALSCFLKASRALFEQPLLWIRMGQCCIAHHYKKMESKISKFSSEFVEKELRSSRGIRYLLRTPNSDMADSDDTSDISLLSASRYLRNALLLLSRDKSMDSTRVSATKQATLLSLAYVSLSIRRPQAALRYSIEVLELKDVHDSNAHIARMYAAEAFCMLNQPTAALRLLDPIHFQSLPDNPEMAFSSSLESLLTRSSISGESASSHSVPSMSSIPAPKMRIPSYSFNKVDSEGILTKSGLFSGIAVANIVNRDLERAQLAINTALSSEPRFSLARRLELYLKLRKGAAGLPSALSLVKQSFIQATPEKISASSMAIGGRNPVSQIPPNYNSVNPTGQFGPPPGGLGFQQIGNVAPAAVSRGPRGLQGAAAAVMANYLAGNVAK